VYIIVVSGYIFDVYVFMVGEFYRFCSGSFLYYRVIIILFTQQ